MCPPRQRRRTCRGRRRELPREAAPARQKNRACCRGPRLASPGRCCRRGPRRLPPPLPPLHSFARHQPPPAQVGRSRDPWGGRPRQGVRLERRTPTAREPHRPRAMRHTYIQTRRLAGGARCGSAPLQRRAWPRRRRSPTATCAATPWRCRMARRCQLEEWCAQPRPQFAHPPAGCPRLGGKSQRHPTRWSSISTTSLLCGRRGC